MNQWVKCTFTGTPEQNSENIPGYINLGLAYRVYALDGRTRVAFGVHMKDNVGVRETPEELVAQLSMTKP
jgi:hypothetical protein